MIINNYQSSPFSEPTAENNTCNEERRKYHEKTQEKASYNEGYSDTEIARFARKRYRKIYSSDISKHNIEELNLARRKLVITKGSGMIKTDWMYTEVIRYLFKMIRTRSEDAPANSMDDLVELFKIIQASYKEILMNDDTSELEDIHVALVEAIHEWAFRYRFEAFPQKVAYGDQWKEIIEEIANTLADMLHSRRQDTII